MIWCDLWTYHFFQFISGWWFGTCFVFPYIGNNHPNWQSHIFQRSWNHHWWTNITMENHHAFNGKINELSMAMFNSYVSHYQRVNLHFPMVFLRFSYGFPIGFPMVSHYQRVQLIIFGTWNRFHDGFPHENCGSHEKIAQKDGNWYKVGPPWPRNRDWLGFT